MEIISDKFECFNTQSGDEDDIKKYLDSDDRNIIIGVKIFRDIIIYCENIDNFFEIESDKLDNYGNPEKYYINENIGNYAISKDDYELYISLSNDRLFLLTYNPNLDTIERSYYDDDGDYITRSYNQCSVIGYSYDDYMEQSGRAEFEALDVEEEY